MGKGSVCEGGGVGASLRRAKMNVFGWKCIL